MKNTITYNTPVLYGDHHVQEVRRILFDLIGVEDVYASSAFQIVEVRFDDEKISEKQLTEILDDAGYLSDWSAAAESGRPATEETDRAMSFFRHTEVFETSHQVVSFAQRINFSGRPLWNCPGFGVIKVKWRIKHGEGKEDTRRADSGPGCTGDVDSSRRAGDRHCLQPG